MQQRRVVMENVKLRKFLGDKVSFHTKLRNLLCTVV
jgi:hypothetical protein